MKVLIQCDGGSRKGNVGGVGYVIFNTDGFIIHRHACLIGEATNNEAEYLGVGLALSAAAELGARQVEIQSDSQLIVKQLSGHWQVKNEPLRILWLEVKAEEVRFESVVYTWISRTKNKLADQLCRDMLDKHMASAQ